MFIKSWTHPSGGIHGYLKRFLASGDATFQHIAIWTLLQLLESEDAGLLDLIKKSTEILTMIHAISENNGPQNSDDDDSEDGQDEVTELAIRCLAYLPQERATSQADQKSLQVRKTTISKVDNDVVRDKSGL